MQACTDDTVLPNLWQNMTMICDFQPCSVAYVSRSGGMSNELNNIISHTTNGVYEGVAIGGDRWVADHMTVM